MRNRVCCIVLIILGVFCLFLIISSVVLIGSIGGLAGKKVIIEPNSYLVMDLSGRISEHAVSTRVELFGSRKIPTLSKILKSLEYASKDPRIAGVVLRPTFSAGFADLREIREALIRFKTSGKPVYAYLEIGTDRDYYLASVADTIAMHPAQSGGLVMLGLGISKTYLRTTFEKVGLKFHVLHVGDFKGAYENFGRSTMSEPLRESLQGVLDGLFETYVTEILSSRPGLDTLELEQTLWNGDTYLLTGALARSLRLIDFVGDWSEFESLIKADDDFHQVSVADYARLVPRLNPNAKEIAVVFAEGGISHNVGDDLPFPSEEGIVSDRMVELLKKLRKDDDVKAVVLRVNSPGGSALASDVILGELRRLRAQKPLVVSMGNIAASGGYYIACEANRILAQPNTITGSIGVVSVIATAEGLYNKIGARIETVDRGKWANFFRPDKDLSSEQRKVLQDLMRGIYDEFVGHVSNGRNLPAEEVEHVAQGRIWTGNQALDRKLVDELGGLHEAIGRACELANVERTQTKVRFYPEPQDIFSMIVNRLSNILHQMTLRVALPPSEIEAKMALDYALRFLHQREFVQALSPIEVID